MMTHSASDAESKALKISRRCIPKFKSAFGGLLEEVLEPTGAKEDLEAELMDLESDLESIEKGSSSNAGMIFYLMSKISELKYKLFTLGNDAALCKGDYTGDHESPKA